METTISERVLSFVAPTITPEIGGKKRYIRYRTNVVELTPEKYEELVSQFPPFWHSEKDKIIHFTVTQENICFCEREKQVYNYATRSPEIKQYIFDGGSPEQVLELKNIILKFFEKEYINQIDALQEKILKGISHLSYLKNDFLRLRLQFLKNSDYIMMPDYPLTEEKRAEWTEYRQALRDMTEQEAWINQDYVNVEFPASPDTDDQVTDIIEYLKTRGIDYTKYRSPERGSVEEFKYFVNNLASLTAKKAIVDSLIRLGVPSINQILYPQFSEFNAPDDEVVNDMLRNMETIAKFDEYKEQIETELQKIDPDMTIDEIYNMVKENMRKFDIDPEVQNLLADLGE